MLAPVIIKVGRRVAGKGAFELKAKKGLIRARVEVSGGRIAAVRFTGDFFMYPEDAIYDLEKVLEGSPADPDAAGRLLEEFFRSRSVQLAGSSVDDFKKALMMAVAEAVGSEGAARAAV